MSPKKKVFLSYKSSDPKDRKSGARIKEIIEQRISQDAVEVFASDESIRAGKKWRPEIRKQLSEADYLIFLYTDRHANWDWCHFESGLFLATPHGPCLAGPPSAASDEEWQNIFCIYPASVGDPPSPLNDYQHIELPTHLERLKCFLTELYVGDDPIRKLWYKNSVNIIDGMAKEICDEVQRMAVTSVPLHRYIILRGTEAPELSRSDGEEIAHVIPDSYFVESDEKSLSEIFRREGSPKGGGSWTWGGVKPSGEQAWISELATAMALYIRDEKTPRRIRSSFKAEKDYTPVLDEINRSSDDYSFHVLFLEQTWEEDRRTEAVSSLKDLMARLVELIRATAPGDTIRYLAYTPALGFLAEAEKQWQSLLSSMESKAAQMDMICLTNDELKLWHGAFKGKRTANEVGLIDGELINRSNAISEKLLTLFRNEGRSPLQKTFDQMPGFYLFKNTRRAIIVAPLGVPLLQRARGKESRIAMEMKDSKVEMFGLDTNVPQIVQNASLVFDAFRR